jgi:hypothetical protein
VGDDPPSVEKLSITENIPSPHALVVVGDNAYFSTASPPVGTSAIYCLKADGSKVEITTDEEALLDKDKLHVMPVMLGVGDTLLFLYDGNDDNAYVAYHTTCAEDVAAPVASEVDGFAWGSDTFAEDFIVSGDFVFGKADGDLNDSSNNYELFLFDVKQGGAFQLTPNNTFEGTPLNGPSAFIDMPGVIYFSADASGGENQKQVWAYTQPFSIR